MQFYQVCQYHKSTQVPLSWCNPGCQAKQEEWFALLLLTHKDPLTFKFLLKFSRIISLVVQLVKRCLYSALHQDLLLGVSFGFSSLKGILYLFGNNLNQSGLWYIYDHIIFKTFYLKPFAWNQFERLDQKIIFLRFLEQYLQQIKRCFYRRSLTSEL